MSRFHEVGVHNSEWSLDTCRSKRSILKRFHLIWFRVRCMICRECIYKSFLNSINDCVHMFLRTKWWIHFRIRIIVQTFFICESEVLDRHLCRNIVEFFHFLCSPDSIHRPSCRVMEEVKSASRFFCEKDIFPYSEILGYFRSSWKSEPRGYPPFVHDTCITEVITFTVTHEEHIMRFRVFHSL